MKSLNEKENLFVISTLMDIQGIEPWTSRMRSVRATTVPNALMTSVALSSGRFFAPRTGFGAKSDLSSLPDALSLTVHPRYD